ncbi:MAG: 2'-5' RNA ligase family protein [Nocardioidaceae bacterium]|nr:2'-5' RNA ligase family protein [Nocardioidaceae bacterium]NUS50060.1 2'-5' RNA ligase family protein [Nocardioidaceae bacterium]
MQTDGAFSALVVPVPELEAVVRPRLERRAPEQLFPEPVDVHAHVTLLAPFAAEGELDEGILQELRTLFADVTPFGFLLTRIAQFPDGPTYLTPEPAAPFRALTHELWRRFPEHPPYGGRFDEVVPHLTVPVPEGENAEQVRFELAPRLPVFAHAREAVLVWAEQGAFRVLERFPFATSAA